MTENVNRAVKTVHKLMDLSAKVDMFKDNKNDIEELISIMNYNSKIENVLNWLLSFEEDETTAPSTGGAILHTKECDKNGRVFDIDVPPMKKVTFQPPISKSEVEQESLPTVDEILEDINNLLNPPTQIGTLEAVKESPITLNGEPIKVEEENLNPYAADDDEVIPEDDTSEMYDDEEEEEEPKSSQPPVVSFDPDAPDLSSYKYLNSELLNRVITNYDKHCWLKHDMNAEWRRNEEFPFMLSDSGKFFNLMTNKIQLPFWNAGELFIDVQPPTNTVKTSKRCGIMLAAVFQIKRPYAGKTDNWVIDFKDGNRRNLSVSNLCYIQKKDKPTDIVLLINDICQRLVDYKFDLKKTMKVYEDLKDTNVNQQFLNELINKKQRSDITNKYWKIVNGKPVVNTPKLPSGNFLDIATTFERSRDITGCIPLFIQKIDGNYDLSLREKELLCNLVKVNLPSGSTYSEMSKNMMETFHWDMTPDEIKSILMNKTNITTIFNQER